MKIVDFTATHIEQATHIAMQNYNEERGFVPALPVVEKLPDLSDIANNRLGVAAIDGEKLVGFMCWEGPWDNHWGLCKGAWSPPHGNGAVKRGRVQIYDKLYQAAAEKLVCEKVFSHAVALYAHDEDAKEAFFQNGFGGRCVDAIRETIAIPTPVCEDIIFRQATVEHAEAITTMSNNLRGHLRSSPMFMPCSEVDTIAGTAKDIESGEIQYFVAIKKSQIVAYYCIKKGGENFASNDATVMNICGAYALPKIRGTGISVGLLSWLMAWLRERGYPRCGVDFECFNYTARNFWLRHFAAYTNSVARRIDERVNLSSTNSHTNGG